MTHDEYAGHDALGLAKLVADGQVSASELLDAALARTAAVNPQIHALNHVFEARGRTDIANGLPSGPFHGVPFALKDLHMAYAGEPTANGSRFWAGNVPARSSELFERYRRAVMASEERDAPTGDRLARIAAQAGRELRSARSFDLFVRDETAVTELHELRKATKRVRYMLEMLDPLSGGALSDVADRFRALQDDLGAIHDCDVWIAEIPLFLARERERTVAYFGSPRPFARIVAGAEHLLEDRRAERSKLYGAFVKTWERELADGLFGTTSELLEGRDANGTGEANDA